MILEVSQVLSTALIRSHVIAACERLKPCITRSHHKEYRYMLTMIVKIQSSLYFSKFTGRQQTNLSPSLLTHKKLK